MAVTGSLGANSRNPAGAQSAVPAFLNREAGAAEEARRALEEAGGFEIHATDARSLHDRLVAARDGGVGRVVVAGGDGTVACAAGVLSNSATEVAIVPGGTLNHFARDHGIPTDLGAAVEYARSASTQNVDVAYAGEHIFLNSCSVGMYVGYVRTRDRLERRLGYRVASVVAFARTFFRLYTTTVEIEIDGVVKRYTSPLVFIGVGERELKAPKLGSRVSDGRRGLHVMIVRGKHKARLTALAFAAAARGVERAARSPELDAFLVDRCSIQMHRPFTPVALDGELVMASLPLEVHIVRDALRVVGAACP